MIGLADPAHLIGLEALGADIGSPRRAVDDDPKALNVRVPTAPRAPVRVRNVVPEAGSFSADVTYRSHNGRRLYHR
jgi:hypothetical protein